MKIIRITAFAALTASLLLSGGCKKDSFTVKGKIEGANGASVVIEKGDYNGRWVAIDSVHTSADGKYSLTLARPASPEIYRICFDGRYVYVPVDSVETLVLDAPAKAFDTQFTLSGTPQAESMMRFEKEANHLPLLSDTDSVARFKRKVYAEVIQRGGADILSYYVLTKTLGSHPLFNLEDDMDMKYFAAVANAYKQFKPNDPHTAMLEETAIQGLRRRNARQGKKAVVEAGTVGYFEISLPNEEGSQRNLSEVAGKGKQVLLAFVPMTHPDSHKVVRDMMNLYQRRGDTLEIYQVSSGDDQYDWRQAARNVPWVTVHEPEIETSKTLRDYNVREFPTFFLLNPQGEVVSRPQDLKSL